MRDCYCGMQIKMRKSKERELKTSQMPIYPFVSLFHNGCFFKKFIDWNRSDLKTIDKINGLIIENLRLFDIHYMSTIWDHKQL
jgi:hypothetical protein